MAVAPTASEAAKLLHSDTDDDGPTRREITVPARSMAEPLMEARLWRLAGAAGLLCAVFSAVLLWPTGPGPPSSPLLIAAGWRTAEENRVPFTELRGGAMGASLRRQSGGGRKGAACHDAAEGEKCYQDVVWVMTQGIWQHPEWYSKLVFEARFEEFQAELHEQNASNCPMPCKAPASARRYAGIPGASLDLPGPWEDRQQHTFYVYRAQSDSDYPLQNVNAADLAGVMWYLHNEIVPSFAVHRKYNITRIIRFKLSMKTTWEFYNVHRRQFGAFVAFDDGRCTVPHCNQVWKQYGFIVGCQHQSMDIAGYQASTKTSIGAGCRGPDCFAPVWYSLPGACPSENFTMKTEECINRWPGGACSAATGARDCTYSVEEAGHISLDELSGIDDYRAFFHAGYREYCGDLDAGIGNIFWNGKKDLKLCKDRIERVKALFKHKYPHLPGCDELEEPPCDFDSYYKDEFTWPVHSRPIKGSTDVHWA
mmetsp:Transcript_1395/g.3090  ORF Transcript_1395/g.3090 Transcript_1395/m.3090 type:complete len:481 (+) Transcript_1395:84-1526(+)